MIEIQQICCISQLVKKVSHRADFFDSIDMGDKTLRKAENQRDIIEIVNLDMIIPKAAKSYEKQLWEEINKGRQNYGKKPFDKNGSNGKMKTIKKQ